MKVLAVISHRFQTASTIICHLASNVVQVSRSYKARQVNNNVHFYMKRSSCVLSLFHKQLYFHQS